MSNGLVCFFFVLLLLLLLVLVKSNLSLWVPVCLTSRQKSVTDHPAPCQLSSGIEREAIFQVKLGQQDGASKTGL